MRYWKGGYDENSLRDLDLRRSRGMPADDSDRASLWLFRVLVAFQIALFSLAVLLSVDWR